MEITITGKLLQVKNIKYKDRNTNEEKSFEQAHFYDGNELFKVTIPENELNRVKIYVGPNPCKLTVDFNVQKKSMYFRDIQ